MHLDDKNSLKSPYKYICIDCNYNTMCHRDYDKHLLTAKHKRLHVDAEKLLKSIEPFVCIKCNYQCDTKSDYSKHCKTKKHTSLNSITQEHVCICGNSYKYRQGLSKHKKVCSEVLSENTPIQRMDTTLVIELLKQNQDFKELMIEQAKQLADQQQQNKVLLEQQQQHNNQLLEAVKDGKIGNTINNTTNNKFNLNFFLNETCKDAITMNEFINSIEVTMEDFVRTGKIGFVDGISTVMVERIKGMDMHTRPIHCTDLKRETLYIKNDDAWEKGDIDKTLLRRAVKNVACKNYRQLKPWFDSSQPQVDQAGTDEYENYFQYYKSALGGCGKEEDRKFEDKIIRNVLKEVVVDK